MRALAPFVARPEQRSVVGVVALTALALTLGWLLRSSILNAARRIEAGGVAAEVPVDWLNQAGVGDLAFSVRGPASPLPRYSVSRLTGTATVSLSDLATDRDATRSRTLTGYRSLDEMPGDVDGREAYRARYAYVADGDSGLPVIVEGLDLHVRWGADVVVISLEAEADAFPGALPRFERFSRSVAPVAEGGP